MKRIIIEQLKAWKDRSDRKPLIVKGARQVGKTYSLHEFGRASFRSTHYLNFEKEGHLRSVFERDLNPKRIIEELSFHLNASIDIDNDFLIFDEIQSIPLAITSLKYFAEDMSALAVCAAGSLLGIHLGESSFPVGKVDLLEMFPMTFMEFLRATGDEKAADYLQNIKIGESLPEVVHFRLWDDLKKYFVVGGLPEVVKTYADNKDDLFVAMDLARKKQEVLVATYHADMAKHCGKQNAMHIERVWRNIPAQLARTEDGSAPKFLFKDVIPQADRYSRLSGIIDWLFACKLIIKVKITNSGNLPFSAYAKENNFKLYLFDAGLLGALSGLAPRTILDYDYGSYKGYFAENFAAQEFLCSGARELYSWSENTAEVEFLREFDGNVLPIEIKSGWVTQAKSLAVFAERYKPKYRTIMSARPLSIDNNKHLHMYPLYLAGRFPLERT